MKIQQILKHPISRVDQVTLFVSSFHSSLPVREESVVNLRATSFCTFAKKISTCQVSLQFFCFKNLSSKLKFM